MPSPAPPSPSPQHHTRPRGGPSLSAAVFWRPNHRSNERLPTGECCRMVGRRRRNFFGPESFFLLRPKCDVASDADDAVVARLLLLSWSENFFWDPQSVSVRPSGWATSTATATAAAATTTEVLLPLGLSVAGSGSSDDIKRKNQQVYFSLHFL